MIVHDLKTPISSIYTAAHLLDAKLSDESRLGAEAMLRIIIRNCKRLDDQVMRIIEENQEFRSQFTAAVRRTRFELRSLIEEVCETVRPLAEAKQTQIQNEIPERLRIYADHYLLTQACQNLLSNALEYAPGGRISIGANLFEEETACWVEDTGPGIPPSELNRIFQVAVGDPMRAESTGLGLAIVKRVAEAHGSRVQLDTDPERGSKFTIFLPNAPGTFS